jgi:hypothetical protein
VDTVSGEMPHRTGWIQKPAKFHDDNPRLKARHHKVLAHELYPELGPQDVTIWLDGTMTPAIDPGKLVQRYLGTDMIIGKPGFGVDGNNRLDIGGMIKGMQMGVQAEKGDAEALQKLYTYHVATFRHASRVCAYQEAEAICRENKDNYKVVRAQMRRYREQDYPYHNGLAETMVVMRRHVPIVQQMNNVWWGEIVNGSIRDQLSFDKACWDVDLEYRRFDFPYSEQKDFTFKGHW